MPARLDHCAVSSSPRRALGVVACVAAMAAGCNIDESGVPPPLDELYYPVDIAAHPDGRYLFVANAVFDRRYNAGTILTYDTWTRRVLTEPEDTRLAGRFGPYAQQIGLFAGNLALGRVDGDGAPVLYATTRENNAIQAYRIGDAPLRAVCTDAGTCGHDPQVSCGDDAACRQDFDAQPPPGCYALAGTVVCADLDCIQGPCAPDADPDAIGTVRSDPFDIALDSGGAWVTHVGRGEITRYSIDPDTGTLFFACALNLEGGASSVAVHPQLGWAYVTDRTGNVVQTVEEAPLDARRGRRGTLRRTCQLVERDRLVVDRSGGGRARGLAFSADGTLLYVASNTDRSLRVYDTTVGRSGRPAHRLVAAIPLGLGPNVVEVAGLRPGEAELPGGLRAGPVDDVVKAKGGGLVYVTAFDADRLVVIDPGALAVIARIDIEDGPNEIAFLPDADGRLQAWISLFRSHELALVDIEPGSPTRFEARAVVR
jgi:YVTN family beta-propeller protein